jgi:hypothetical protein
MRSFFQSLERESVRYLLISGQASILYGAATFSEDVDLWIEPSAANIDRLVEALRRCKAVAHKLTPPLTVRNFRHGHGFHFRVPSPGGSEWYLDVMGKPPRVGGFSVAARRAAQFETPWGTIPVVAIQDLVELKKTRRLADYDVISNLACIRLRTSARITRPLLQWALRNVFRVEDAQWVLERWPAARSLPVVRERTLSIAGIAREIAVLQRNDMRYWSPIIDELRTMRKSGVLLVEGTPIQAIDKKRPRAVRPFR